MENDKVFISQGVYKIEKGVNRAEAILAVYEDFYGSKLERAMMDTGDVIVTFDRKKATNPTQK